MSNVLKQTKREQVRALGQLGWPLRRIEAETGVRRETIARYLRAAGIAVARPGRRGDGAAKAAIETSTDQTQGKRGVDPPGEGADEANAAIEASTDSAPQPWPPKPQRSPQASACEVHRDLIAALVARRRNAKQIWRDLVDGHGFVHRYASVQRFVRSLRGTDAGRDAHAVIETAPGEEAQVDYGGEGPMVRDPVTANIGGRACSS